MIRLLHIMKKIHAQKPCSRTFKVTLKTLNYIMDKLQVRAKRRHLRSNNSCSSYFGVPKTSHMTFADRSSPVIDSNSGIILKTTLGTQPPSILCSSHFWKPTCFRRPTINDLLIYSVTQHLWTNIWCRHSTNWV